jgi:hypothetical protein
LPSFENFSVLVLLVLSKIYFPNISVLDLF